MLRADETDSSDPPVPDGTLRAVIAALPLRQREALFRRFYLDLDYAAIAKVLDIQVGTDSATLHAARSALAKKFGGGSSEMTRPELALDELVGESTWRPDWQEVLARAGQGAPRPRR